MFQVSRFKNKGASLILTILILTAILSIAFGISALTIGEIKITQEIPKSLKAYYAAEAGIERTLYDDDARRGSGAADIGSPPSCSGGGAVCLDGSDNCYSVDYNYDVGTDTITIKSYGCYKGTRRAIEVSY